MMSLPSDRGLSPARMSKRRNTLFLCGFSVILEEIVLKTVFSCAVWRTNFSTFCTDLIQCLLLYRRFNSRIINDEISMPSIIQTTYFNGEIPMPSVIHTIRFADDQWRDTDAFFYTDGSLRRLSTARYQCLLLYRRFTSPLYNGEISVTFICRGVYLTVVQRRDFSHFYMQRCLPRHCSVTFIYRCIYLAVVQRQSFDL